MLILFCLQIDLQKMPLGKLSKRQIQSAYALLSEVQQVSRSAPVSSDSVECEPISVNSDVRKMYFNLSLGGYEGTS